MIEYWSGQKSDFQFPTNVKFEYKTDTDLFEFVAVSILWKFIEDNVKQL